MIINGRKLIVRRERLNSGGYTSGRYGSYFGSGAPLYLVEDEETGESMYVRAQSREGVAAIMRQEDRSSPFYWEVYSFWRKINKGADVSEDNFDVPPDDVTFNWSLFVDDVKQKSFTSSFMNAVREARRVAGSRASLSGYFFLKSGGTIFFAPIPSGGTLALQGKPVRSKNPLTMGGTTERNVLIGVAVVSAGVLLYEALKSPAGVSSTATGSSAPVQPYLITVPMSSTNDPAMSVPSGATLQINEPSGGTGGFTAGLVGSPTTAGTDASGNILLNYVVTAASGTSGSYAWTSGDGNVIYSIPINVT